MLRDIKLRASYHWRIAFNGFFLDFLK